MAFHQHNVNTTDLIKVSLFNKYKIYVALYLKQWKTL